jgi:hypothetical protein
MSDRCTRKRKPRRWSSERSASSRGLSRPRVASMRRRVSAEGGVSFRVKGIYRDGLMADARGPWLTLGGGPRRAATEGPRGMSLKVRSHGTRNGARQLDGHGVADHLPHRRELDGFAGLDEHVVGGESL